MNVVRRWSVRHSRGLEIFYQLFEKTFLKMDKLWRLIGIERIEKPAQFVEKTVKGFMFDCHMCGQCALSSTGMSCSMNCPKTLRNGPCGGVRLDGNCEVKADMPCVWVEAWKGSEKMKQSKNINLLQPPVDHQLKGTSSWLKVLREEGQKPKEFADDARIKR